ncbi:hypothetical protein JCM33374_g997 [Metschnikowia sp. JCM 33374]|nr:hypothetical protein JCM33374_g997 [Metschnikowia sp. JCM 33374]
MSEEHQLLPTAELVSQNNLTPLFPHLYYIDPTEPNYDHFSRVIREHGGHLTLDSSDRSAFHLSSSPWPDRQTYMLQFVNSTIQHNTPVQIEEFAFHRPQKKRPNPSYEEEALHALDVSNSSLSSMDSGVKRPRDKLSKSTTKFTPEADAYILEQVRMRPRFRTSHKFFEDLAKHEMLKGHTGNSVRSRYRAHLEHKLQYVFKTDAYDNLVLDEEGQKIPVEVSSAKTMKNKFTAEDDYNLCNDVIRHVSSIQNNNAPELPNGLLDEDKFSVSISFFDDYARRNPQHSSSSWRDRYRKFARPHGLQKYRDEYLRDCNTKEGPKPMKNMTSRKDRDRGQNRDPSKYPKEAKEKMNMRKAAAKNAVMNDTTTAAAAVQALLGGHDSSQMAELDSSHMAEHDPSQMAELERMNQEMDMASREAAPLDEEIGGNRDENIDVMLQHMQPGISGTNVDSEVGAMGMTLRHSMSQVSYHYAYLPDNVSIDDLFENSFYGAKNDKIMTDLEIRLADLGEADLESISEILQQYGFTKAFIGHVFRITSGVALPMTRYFQRFFRLIGEAGNSMNKILYPENVPGMWTPQTDEAFLHDEYDKLEHMKGIDFEHRRYFLEASQ